MVSKGGENQLSPDPRCLLKTWQSLIGLKLMNGVSELRDWCLAIQIDLQVVKVYGDMFGKCLNLWTRDIAFVFVTALK